MLIVKCLIVLYLGLLPLSAWVYRKQLPSWLLVLYACPVLLSLLGWQTVWGFIFGLILACGVRVIGGHVLFGKNRLSHFLAHFLLSLVLALALLAF
ncbi:hypothetical protein JXX06_09080 [Streptococcus suis]|uniref:Uncharacterized protein n=1 Tax=Streptococcus suis 6407 TaxID=1214179 RepID=A0A075SM33_STRSU|nr:hypothetical protein [Streptococcus suis]AIG44446.1 hypothetical protein ID09_10600 [Streptococcus suis 6407]MBM6380935.1 hypothetical protein [Streptococcus suis]MBM6390683.1 hypothetical protein [Streptococcus suis]MBM6392728.1 hypothetical protein [Streptococcus suis]MBM6438890.1 hypothetical protein [Streptococcus suis]